LAAAEAETGDTTLTRIDEAITELEKPVTVRTRQRLTVFAARFYSSATPPTQHPRRKPSSPPSPLRSSRRREASSYAQHCRWRSFINRPAAPPPTRMPSSPLRSKAFRPRRSFRRSPRRKRCSPRSPRPTKSKTPLRPASAG
jgi:hypothetical protein